MTRATKGGQSLTGNLRVMQEPIISCNRFYYLKVALILMGAAIAIYAVHSPLGGPNGGTWLGYTLGTISALICFWLGWFGIRKRRYGVGAFKLQEWMSAHVYLGLSLVVLATLHTGFQVGLNVHTLAYVLMMIVIMSGIVGLYLYIRLPARMSQNRGGITFDQLMGLISELDTNCMNLAVKLGDEVNDLVREAADNSVVGGGFAMQLTGYDPNCPTKKALDRIGEMARDFPRGEADTGRQLVLYLARKNEMLQVARRDVQFRAWLGVWLLVHVPATVGLLVALVIHIVSVFFYW